MENIKGVFEAASAINVISKCPAIILAANRIDSVKGRIILLIVSIITIKGIKIVGVPLGIKWINLFLVLINIICIIKPTQNGKANVSVNAIWLVGVKFIGNKPGKLLQIIKINSTTEKISIWGYFLIKGTNSFSKFLWTIDKISFIWLFINQTGKGRIIRHENIINQLKDVFVVVAGSKIEKRFVIILFFLLRYYQSLDLFLYL